MLQARMDHLADFRIAERRGSVRFERDAMRLTGVRVEAGRNVHSKDRNTRTVHPMQYLGVQALHVRVQTGAEDRVYQDAGTGESLLDGSQPVVVGHFLQS